MTGAVTYCLRVPVVVYTAQRWRALVKPTAIDPARYRPLSDRLL
jgi:hypothetical protein